MITVDVYLRCATDEDAADRFQQQETACRAYCAEHELTVGLVMSEVANGLTYNGRPSLDLIRARYRNHIISGVVVTTADRITRDHVKFATFVKELARYNAKLFCTREPFDDTPMGKYARMVLEFVSAMEAEHADC